MQVLVTGGAGFIGSHLVDRLIADAHRVRVLDNFATGHRSNLEHVRDDVEVLEGDIRSFERAATAARGCDIVLHQAALPSVPRSIQDPLTTHEVNVGGTLNVLLASRDAGVGRVVLASSSSVYGANPQLPKHEELTLQPISPYAVSKAAAEGYARAFRTVYDLETVSLRYFNVFGPRQDPGSPYAAVIPLFIEAMLEDRRPVIFGDGEQSRDFTYISNVIDANILAMSSAAAAGGAYNIARGDSVSLNDVIRQLGELTGRAPEADRRKARAGDVRHSWADISAARRDLGYHPAISFRDGLEQTLQYHSERRNGLGVA